MKQLIKTVLSFINTSFSLIAWCIWQTINGLWTYGKVQKSEHNKTIRIIANSPSLNEELEQMDMNVEADYCMVNDSMTTPLFRKFRPSRFVLADPLYFNRDLEGDNNPRVEAFKQCNWQMQLYVPKSVVSIVKDKLRECKTISIHALPSSLPKSVSPFSVRNFFYRRGMACPIIQNVLVGAIYTSLMSGYKNIELYGVGHTWTTQLAVNELNQVCLSDVHYYDLNAPMQPWITVEGKPYKMHTVLRDLAQMFDSYWDLREFADTIPGVLIINKTRGSFIDAFVKG